MKTLHRRIISFILALIAVLVFPLATVSASGSATGSCIVEIAKNEVGYMEEGDNITKYGAWCDIQDEWCSIFVAWCANQAGISTAIIPLEPVVPDLAVFYQSINRYYLSPSRGGTAEPQVGDLFFHSNKNNWYYPSQDHVGIIVAVDSNSIRTVEGNWGNGVVERTIPKNDQNFVGFARPAYTSSYTTPIYDCDGEGHTPICADCGLVNWYGFEEHVYTSFKGSASGHWSVCSICRFGFSDNIIPHRYGNAYDYSDTFHWKICLDCGYPHSTRTVHMFTEDMTTGINTCEICGYEYNPYLTHENDGPEHLIE